MFGIGNQTLNTAKGLEALSSNITIGIPASILNPTFVNLCKPLCPFETYSFRIKKTPERMGLRIRGNKFTWLGLTR